MEPPIKDILIKDIFSIQDTFLVPNAHCPIQWSLKKWTLLGPEESVLIRDANNTCLYCVGTKQSVQYTRGVLISGCPHIGVPLTSEQRDSLPSDICWGPRGQKSDQNLEWSDVLVNENH